MVLSMNTSIHKMFFTSYDYNINVCAYHHMVRKEM